MNKKHELNFKGLIELKIEFIINKNKKYELFFN